MVLVIPGGIKAISNKSGTGPGECRLFAVYHVYRLGWTDVPLATVFKVP